jgi:transposase InsO family protein
MRCSMSRKGNCRDNALTESFFKQPEESALHEQGYRTRRAALDAVPSC